MKTLVTLLKIAMLVTTLSFVMSCDKNNKRSNNTAVTAFGQQQCNGNSNLYVFIRGQQYACQYDNNAWQTFQQYTGCWVSCAQTNCSGQIAYPGSNTQYSQQYAQPYNQQYGQQYNQQYTQPYNQYAQTQPQGYQCL